MGLLDIAPPEITGKRFEIRGGTLNVRGIKNREWVVLLKRFPEIRKLLNGEMDIVEFYSSTADGLVSAVIAAGFGNCEDKDTEELIQDRLSEAEQFVVFETIMELGSIEKEEARKKINPLPESPETGKLLNGGADQTKMKSQQPSLL